jgi:hypothetical protein
VAKYLGLAAVGTSSGAVYVLLPGAAATPGGKQAQQPARRGGKGACPSPTQQMLPQLRTGQTCVIILD